MTSRNRPRAGLAKEDLGDELQLWNSIVEKIKKCSSINKQYQAIAVNIESVEEKMRDNEANISITQVDELEKLHRMGLKYADEELKILNEEPDDLIKNLETLISVRAAFETIETPRNPLPAGKLSSRNPKRRIDAMDGADSPAAVSDAGPPSKMVSKTGSRSGSVAATSVKSEGAADGIDINKVVGSDKQNRFTVGTEVFFKNKNKHSEGEGILCQITNVIGDGKQRRYEIQDIEPEYDENGAEPQPYRASVQSLVAIPQDASSLPEVVKGKQVFALYPNTTTFYKAEMVGMRKEHCRLRFEGEDEKDKEQEVERRYVLDVK